MKRNVQWNENIECLDKRLDRFEEMLNTKCTNALNTSKQIINQNSYYKLFDKDDINVSLMPKYFQNMYIEYQKQKTSGQNCVIDHNVSMNPIESNILPGITVPSHNICDSSLNSIDFQSISNNKLTINSTTTTISNNNNNNNDTSEHLIKLPNPMGSELISGSNVINENNETSIPEITE